MTLWAEQEVFWNPSNPHFFPVAHTYFGRRKFGSSRLKTVGITSGELRAAQWSTSWGKWSRVPGWALQSGETSSPVRELVISSAPQLWSPDRVIGFAFWMRVTCKWGSSLPLSTLWCWESTWRWQESQVKSMNVLHDLRDMCSSRVTCSCLKVEVNKPAIKGSINVICVKSLFWNKEF